MSASDRLFDPDPDDPYAPKIERLEPVQPMLRARTPSEPKASVSRRKVAPSQGDRSLLDQLAPDRPDLAKAGGDIVLLPASPTGSGTNREEEPEEDWDEKYYQFITKQKEEEDRKRKEDEELLKKEERKEREMERIKLQSAKALGLDYTRDEKENDSPPIRPRVDSSIDFFPPTNHLAADIDPERTRRMEDHAREVTSTAKTFPEPHPIIRQQIKLNGHAARLPNLDISKTHREIPQGPQTACLPRIEPRAPQQRKNSLQPYPTDGLGIFNGSHQSLDTVPFSRYHLQHRDGPSQDTRLPAINPNVNSPFTPSSVGSPSSPQQLPSAKSLLRIADEQIEEQLRLHHRQHSISSISAVTAPSPTIFSAGAPPSPYPTHAASPPTSLDSATSPRDYITKLPSSAATSPTFHPGHNIFRRHSQASDILPSFRSLGTDSYTASPDAFTSDTPSTNITTPSDTGGRAAETPRNVSMGPPVPLSINTAASIPTVGQPYLTSPNNTLAVVGVTGRSPSSVALPAINEAPQNNTTSPVQGPGSFQCGHPNCNTPPFLTQYLLNSHTTVHSVDRPHFCPVVGCNRATVGFKRKNEMIRHQLVHESPGYICPFCPSRLHKYPRPDNLQRHVRVHHPDVQSGNEQLRSVLDKKAFGRGAGRRRKGNPY